MLHYFSQDLLILCIIYIQCIFFSYFLKDFEINCLTLNFLHYHSFTQNLINLYTLSVYIAQIRILECMVQVTGLWSTIAGIDIDTSMH